MKNFNRLGLAAITSLALSLPVGAWAQATPKAAAPAKPAAAKTAAKPAPTTIEEQVVVRTWRQVTPESAQAMRDGAVQSLRLIRAARADIAKKQDKAARTKLETALTALQGVKSLEPITSVRTKVDNAANGAEVDAIALYRRDVVPVAAVVSAHETITDLGQVKAAMASTDQAAASGNGATTKAELIKVRTRLDAAIAEMPVTKTFDRVAAANLSGPCNRAAGIHVLRGEPTIRRSPAMHPFARLGCGVALSLALATPAFAQTYMVVEQVMVRTWRDATPQHYQAMRDGSADTVRLINEARAEIGRGNLPLAQDHVESALSILQGVKSLDPIVLARATIETTRQAPDGQFLAQFQRDIMPLATTIQNYGGVADVVPAQQAMAAAIAAANAGNAALARSELGRLGASLDPVIAALPVNHTYQALAEAGDVLRARRGAEGDRLLAEAQKDMTLKVVDIRNGN